MRKYKYLTEEELDNLARFPWKGLVIGMVLSFTIPLVLVLVLTRIL